MSTPQRAGPRLIREGLSKGLVIMRPDGWCRAVRAGRVENSKRRGASEEMVLQHAAAKQNDGQLLEQTKVVPAFCTLRNGWVTRSGIRGE